MKVTVVPAQVTTVEDRIIGSLGLSQDLTAIRPDIRRLRIVYSLAASYAC